MKGAESALTRARGALPPQNRLRRCLRGPRRGSLSNAMRVQGGFDAVIRRIRRLQKTAIFRVGDGTLNRLIRMRCAKAPLRRTRGALPRKIAYGDICGDPGGALHQMLCEFEIRSLNKTVAKNRDLSCQTRKRPRTGARCTWSYISGRVKALDKAIRRIRRLQKTAIFRVRQGSAPERARGVLGRT